MTCPDCGAVVDQFEGCYVCDRPVEPDATGLIELPDGQGTVPGR
jgi:hypothetical protein